MDSSPMSAVVVTPSSRLGDGDALVGRSVVVPVDFHVILDDLTLHLSHTGKPPLFDMGNQYSPFYQLRCHYTRNPQAGKTYLWYAGNTGWVSQGACFSSWSAIR